MLRQVKTSRLRTQDDDLRLSLKYRVSLDPYPIVTRVDYLDNTTIILFNIFHVIPTSPEDRRGYVQGKTNYFAAYLLDSMRILLPCC